MPVYQYACEKCRINITNTDITLPSNYEILGIHDETGEFLFTVEVPMAEMKKTIACPICNTECDRSYTDLHIVSYVRGQGIVTDTAGAKRDMHRHTLEKKDPYAYMRQSGEVDCMVDKLRRGGIDMGKIRSRRSNKEIKSVDVELTENEKILVKYMGDHNDKGYVVDMTNLINDVNGSLTSLLHKNIVCRNSRNDNLFELMAEGRQIAESLGSKSTLKYL